MQGNNYFGAYRSANPKKHLSKIAIAIRKTKLLIIDAAPSEMFVAIKTCIVAKGKPIPENDIWIAGTALQYQLPLYTNDNHFEDVEGITLI